MSSKRRHFGPPADRYLQETTQVRVRFQEVDSMGVVWHGHYLTYFEAARCGFGRRYGFAYSDFATHGFQAPLVHSAIDHFAPARFDEELAVRARLHVDASARIDFTYRVARAADDHLLVLGRTVQVLTTPTGELCVAQPRFVVEFLARWRDEIAADRGSAGST